MKTITLIKVAGDSIRKNRLRAALTMLGIIIGVAAVVVMVAIGQGARERIRAQIDGLGSNMIIVTPGASTQGGVSQGAAAFANLTVEDAEQIRRESTTLTAVSPVVMTRSQVIGPGSNWRTTIQGVDTDYQIIRDWDTANGTFFVPDDVRSSRKVAVLGNTVAEQLFPGIDPVGQEIQIGKVRFDVVGVLESKGQMATGNDQDDVILVPHTTAATRLSGWSRISQILASTPTESMIPLAQQEIASILRDGRRIAPGVEDDFTVRSQTELAEAAESSTRIMTLLLAAIASISLLVGGIGIMNIMLVSVTERTREIGIRMAIGARGSDVLTQFLIESIVLGILGGVIGLAAGFAGSEIFARITGFDTVVSPAVMVIAVLFSGAVGVFFGYYPARKAAALHPIEALRFE